MCWLARAKNWRTVRGAGLAQGLEQPLDHRAEQLVGLEVQRRPRQPRVAAVEQGGAELVQPADGPVQQGPDDGSAGASPASASR